MVTNNSSRNRNSSYNFLCWITAIEFIFGILASHTFASIWQKKWRQTQFQIHVCVDKHERAYVAGRKELKYYFLHFFLPVTYARS